MAIQQGLGGGWAAVWKLGESWDQSLVRMNLDTMSARA